MTIAQGLPEVASLYSQLTGVLAGFAFAGIIALLTAQLSTSRTFSRSLASGSPLVAAFIGLVLSSLNYAVVAGEEARTPRIATLQAIAGMGFAAAALVLFYSIFVLVRGLELDVPESGDASKRMADLIGNVLVLAICPIAVLLMWNGARDHLIQKYGKDAGFHGLDWVALAALAVVMLAGVAFRVVPTPPRAAHRRVTEAVTYASVSLALVSVAASAMIVTVTNETSSMPDAVPGIAVVLVALFSLQLAYSVKAHGTEGLRGPRPGDVQVDGASGGTQGQGFAAPDGCGAQLDLKG